MPNFGQVRPIGCLATSTGGRNAQLAGIPSEEAILQGNLLRLRAVLILLAAGHGSKMATASVLAGELNSRQLAASMRSLYRWRDRYLRSGFAGMTRKRRNDAGYPRGFDQATLARIVDAATRVKKYGDLAREYRGIRASISPNVFRFWIRKIQRQLRVSEMPAGEERLELLS